MIDSSTILRMFRDSERHAFDYYCENMTILMEKYHRLLVSDKLSPVAIPTIIFMLQMAEQTRNKFQEQNDEIEKMYLECLGLIRKAENEKSDFE